MNKIKRPKRKIKHIPNLEIKPRITLYEERKIAILEFLKYNEKVNQEEFMINIKIPLRRLQECLRDLEANGIVKRERGCPYCGHVGSTFFSLAGTK